MMDLLYSIPPAILDDAILKSMDADSSFENAGDIQLDAAFIPTRGAQTNLLRQLGILGCSVKHIFVLATKPTATIEQISPSSAELIFLDPLLHSKLLISSSSRVVTNFCDPNFDLPTKRNLALQISRERGFRAILLVDDDIALTSPLVDAGARTIRNGATIAATYSLKAPDISTIDLVRSRLTKTKPRVSISGSCVFVDPAQTTGFFPYVYNEDWLFFAANILAGKQIVRLTSSSQLPRTDNPQKRVLFEQFGDVVAWGLRILPSVSLLTEVSAHFWNAVYDEYLTSLRELYLVANRASLEGRLLHSALNALSLFTGYDVQSFAVSYLKECFQ